MHNSGDLNYCQQCGGVLELVSGTDPEEAKERQKWQEKYECSSCGGTGYYHVDETNNRISERFSGVCAEVNYA
jgi:uncharacterized protein with PIN domain